MALRHTAVLLLAVLCCVLQVHSATTVSKRSLKVIRDVDTTNATAETETKPTTICQRKTPCGWAVYKRITRYIDYFMKNQCECPVGLECVRTDDDISISAYVYRCLPDPNKKKSATDS